MAAEKIIVMVIILMLINLTNCTMETNSGLQQTYTLGIWKVTPGMDKEFISEWTTFANWTSETYTGGVGRAYLLRDETDSLRFISFGHWDDEITIRNWRDSEKFKNFAAKVKNLCDDFQPNTLKVASKTLDFIKEIPGLICMVVLLMQ